MKQPQYCLNCRAPLEGNFCKDCGQAASTHRFTFKHVFGHDFLHAMFHFGGGFFFTLKELFTRPGHSIREYVAGKRVRHLSYFSFLIVIVLLFSGAEAITDFNYASARGDDESRHIVDIVNNSLKHHPKIIFIGILPLLALTTWILFRKARHNFAEHFVLNTYKQASILLINVLFVLVVSRISENSIPLAERWLSVLTMSYAVWYYYQYFTSFYTRKVLLLLRVIVAAFVPLGIIMVLLSAYFSLYTV
ncbi:MAG TPA: DUF3667 domain-containing protein [Cyclobacteriaceae bacterium]|nr:DUF3667 domain-containing protein [Cyclobacteriaceae bacterium]